QHYLFDMESAEQIKNQITRQLDKDSSANIAVLGGGYTGVELVSAILDFLKNKPHKLRLFLFNRGNRILKFLPDHQTSKIENWLMQQGVELRMNTTPELNELTQYEMVIHTTGVQGTAVDLFSYENKEQQVNQRIKVDKNLLVSDSVFAAGDCAAFLVGEQQYHRPSAYIATIQGKIAALNVTRLIKQQKLLEYQHFDPGFIIPVFSMKQGFGKLLGIKLGGFTGFLVSKMITLIRIPGMRHKLSVLKKILD
ncbi:MAG: FAD-dependent oxidoreductase, partial [Spirochaetes bacterium]|nr:FAD-dependent oxidoreductase [Spirochaetota bacterium]